MHDIRAIRENPEAFDTGLETRGVTSLEGADGPPSKPIVALDEKLRAAVTAKQELETERNTVSKQIGQAKGRGDEAEFERLRAETARLKDELDAKGEEEAAARAELDALLAGIPNLPADDVPVGPDEDANEEVRGWGEPRAFDFEVRDHVAVGEGLGQMDFETAAAMSGSRFVMLTGQLARLERALAQFMLDLHTSEHGYTEVAPPFLVRDEALFGTGQLPKFREDLFHTPGVEVEDAQRAVAVHLRAKVLNEGQELAAELDDIEAGRSFYLLRLRLKDIKQPHWLIPTSEVPLTNIAAGAILEVDTLPRRYTAWTPCFRSEAGSAGRDTRGMIRLHQFQKVELVSITRPEESDDELERMTGCAEEVLRRLELPYRVMKLSTGDMGFAARRTYDLEVWLPSQGTYREISSCSTCGDFQARRMDARYRPEPREGEKKKPRPEFVHTLNGSGVACGRALVAVLENFQEADGSVTIPDVLRPYMGGAERIGG